MLACFGIKSSKAKANKARRRLINAKKQREADRLAQKMITEGRLQDMAHAALEGNRSLQEEKRKTEEADEVVKEVRTVCVWKPEHWALVVPAPWDLPANWDPPEPTEKPAEMDKFTQAWLLLGLFALLKTS